MRTKQWRDCSKCGVKYHSLHEYEGKELCWKCYYKAAELMPQVKNPFTLKRALNKIYTVREKKRNGLPEAGNIQVPRALLGLKVKLVVIEGGKS